MVPGRLTQREELSTNLGIHRVGEYPAEEGRDGLAGINPITEGLPIAGAAIGNLYRHSEAVEPLIQNIRGAA